MHLDFKSILFTKWGEWDGFYANKNSAYNLLPFQLSVKNSFFEESEQYWAPANEASELYQQMSTKKYREIPRNQIRLEMIDMKCVY